MSEMSHEEALAEIQAAVAADPDFGGTPPVEDQAAPTSEVTPAGETPGEVPPTPEAPVAPAAPAEDTFTERFNPDTLDPALLPAWRQLQADYTRKTQEIAEQRKQFEALGGVEAAQEAIELYQRISDPSNWAQLHQELSEAMQEAGLTPAQADALAREELQAQAASPSIPGLDGLAEDPDLAPLAQAIKQMQATNQSLEQRLQALDADRQMQLQAEEAERAQAAHLANMQAQAFQIREMNPAYTDEDMRAIVRLAPFHGDDLLQAQADYESIVAARLERYFAGKQHAATPSIQPQPGAGVESVQDNTPKTVEEAAEEAMEYVRAMQAAGELDF